VRLMSAEGLEVRVIPGYIVPYHDRCTHTIRKGVVCGQYISVLFHKGLYDLRVSNIDQGQGPGQTCQDVKPSQGVRRFGVQHLLEVPAREGTRDRIGREKVETAAHTVPEEACFVCGHVRPLLGNPWHHLRATMPHHQAQCFHDCPRITRLSVLLTQR